MYDSIKKYEGFRNKAYQDQGGKWTIGYGQTELNGRPVQPGDTISKEEADNNFQQQVAPYAQRAQELAPNLNPQQHEALTSLIYNYGVNSPRVARLGQLISEGAPQDAIKNYWLSSDTVHGQPNAGLANRRAQEYAMFSGNPVQGGEENVPFHRGGSLLGETYHH